MSQSYLPSVTHVYTVAPNILALQIQLGEITKGTQVDYEALPGDSVDKNGWIRRDGEAIGYLVDAEQSTMRTLDQFRGSELDQDWLQQRQNYEISAANDAIDSDTPQPVEVFHKVKPLGLAQVAPWDFESPELHTVHLKLSAPLETGATYQLDFAGEAVLQDLSFTYNPSATRSEAVHVSQLGFDPDDPAKVAFLSTWMGPNAPLDYAPGTDFWLVDTKNGNKVYAGELELSTSKDDDEDERGRNYNGTDVYLMDFSDFDQPGNYQVLVDGVGTSFAFEIGEKTWETAFYTSIRGLYHQRSGIALEQPYTDYERSRPFHPEDGVPVYQSTVPLMDTDMGLNLADVSAFEALMETQTEALVTDAWGGWFDAGDWDRRIQHLGVSRQLLELAASNPAYFEQLGLNLPESNNEIPDVMDEALWGLDLYKRLQFPDGGIPGGIESAGHPRDFEASWQESQAVMVYGPGIWSSYIYAGVAARAAGSLQAYDPALAQEYAASAERAMAWAEAEYANNTGEPSVDIDNQRNLAAAELYRLTGTEQWHQVFLETTVFTEPGVQIFQSQDTRQEDAAFVYAQTEHDSVNQAVQNHALAAIVQEAETQIGWIERTGFKWQKNPWAPLRWGTSLGAPDATTQIRAHQLTGEAKYLEASILASQFSAGANPDNLVYTTGVGERYPQDPLIADVRATGMAPPPGITVFGPFDQPSDWDWAFELFGDAVSPWPTAWPTAEGYFDAYFYIPTTEFTVHQTIAPTAYTWGYLAAVDEVNLNGAPTFDSPSSLTVDENTVLAGTILATDPEGETVTVALSGGPDADRFQVDAETGELTFQTWPDFETPVDADGDNVYEIRLSASDGQAVTSQAFTVQVIEVEAIADEPSPQPQPAEEYWSVVGDHGDDELLHHLPAERSLAFFFEPGDLQSMELDASAIANWADQALGIASSPDTIARFGKDFGQLVDGVSELSIPAVIDSMGGFAS